MNKKAPSLLDIAQQSTGKAPGTGRTPPKVDLQARTAARTVKTNPAPQRRTMTWIVLGAVAVVAVLLVGAAYLSAQNDGWMKEVTSRFTGPGRPTVAFTALAKVKVNLNDADYPRMAVVGATIQTGDREAQAKVEQYKDRINTIVMEQVGQRSYEELLTPQGKDALLQDIARETDRLIGAQPGSEASTRVLLDHFIIK